MIQNSNKYKSNLISEYTELIVRLTKLNKFLDDISELPKGAKTIDEQKFNAMSKQQEIMREYSIILRDRICLEMGVSIHE